MAHSHAHLREVHPGRRRAHEMSKHFKRGGSVHSDEAADRKLFGKMLKQHEKEEMKAEGKKSGGRLDKRARGGRTKHSDEAEDRKLMKKMMAEHEKKEMKVEGTLRHKDGYARGGRAKGKGGHHTKINIVVAPKGPHPADGAAPAGALPPVGPGGPPLPPPGLGAGPGGPPPMPPPGMKPPGMMKKGGRVKYARGGGIAKLKKLGMTAGSDSGEGRLQKAHKYSAR